MSSSRGLAAAVIGVGLLIAGTGCQDGTPQTQGSTVTTQSAKMPDLPTDPVAAKAVVRRMLMTEAVVLLKASGLKYTGAQFDVPFSYDRAQIGDLLIQALPCTAEQVQAMTTAIWAHGWQKAGISHDLSVFKGPLFLHWGSGDGGCDFRMTTVDISQHLEITNDITDVPELAAFEASKN